MAITTIVQVGQMGNEMIKRGTTVVDNFKAKLESDPVSAFEWSYEAFKGAAQLRVGNILWQAANKANLTDKDFVAAVKDTAMREVIHGARHAPRSTSVQSNEIMREVVSVWAEVLNRLDGGF